MPTPASLVKLRFAIPSEHCPRKLEHLSGGSPLCAYLCQPWCSPWFDVFRAAVMAHSESGVTHSRLTGKGSCSTTRLKLQQPCPDLQSQLYSKSRIQLFPAPSLRHAAAALAVESQNPRTFCAISRSLDCSMTNCSHTYVGKWTVAAEWAQFL